MEETLGEFHDRKIAELPYKLLAKAVDCLQTFVRDEDKESLLTMYNRYNKDRSKWFLGNHHGYGTYVRNALRKVITDDKLPSGNWDDYYIPCIEIAIGVRPMPEEVIPVTADEFYDNIIKENHEEHI